MHGGHHRQLVIQWAVKKPLTYLDQRETFGVAPIFYHCSNELNRSAGPISTVCVVATCEEWRALRE